MALQLSFGEATATGPRTENQDAIRVVTPAPALAASKGFLFALADGGGKKLSRQAIPQIDLKSPKISRKLTTEWFAKRVEGRYRSCLKRSGS